MINEKTNGGLLIVPRAYFVDPKDLEGFQPVRMPIHEEDEFDEGFNPIEDHEDDFLDHPFRFSFDFFDPNTALGPPLPQGKQRKYERSLPDTLITIDSADEDTFDKITGTFGMNPPPSMTSIAQAVTEREFSGAELTDLFTTLGRKAATNIANGKVKREDLTEFIRRDNGDYVGDDLTRIVPHALTTSTRSKFTSQRDTLPDQVIDEIMKMNMHEGHTFPYAFDMILHHSRDKSPQKKEIVATSMLSTIVHAIGDNEFLPTFLDALDTIDKSTTREFLGEGTKIGTDVGNRIQRALPIKSSYHEQFVRSRYKSIC
jgi:hypothetical protein